MTGARILLVDDDPAILRAVKRSLELKGYQVATAVNGRDAEQMALRERPDIVVLDLVLPDTDGIAVCKSLRQTSDVPVIVLSAVEQDARKVEALNSGADDYVTKPFSMEELDARIRVWLRRSVNQSIDAVLHAGPLMLDVGSHDVRASGMRVRLTPKEFDLLRLLMEKRGRVLTQRTILENVWGEGYGDDSYLLRTFIHQLRKKLEAVSPPAASMIINEPGVGYRLALSES
jgi:two-component system KDP operon response regulator KdpE